MQCLLIDLDGVVYQNDQLIEGAAASVNWLQEHKIPHLFVTNTTSKPRSAIVRKLAALGIDVDEDSILTPVVAAKTYITQHQFTNLAVFTVESTRSEFGQWSLIENDRGPVNAVILGDMGKAWDFSLLNRAFRLLMADSATQLIALGMTRYWQTGDGLQLDVGPFAQALAYATGKEPVVMGKPAPTFFAMAAGLLGYSPDKVAMIGDDAYSDVKAAQDNGLYGILVKTGKFRHEDLVQMTPNSVLDSFADLPSIWDSLP